MGSLWSKNLANTMSNPFWKEVLTGWGEFLDKKTLSPTEALSSPIWYNSGISTEPLFFSHWYNAGICVPLDIMQNGSLKHRYKCVSVTTTSSLNRMWWALYCYVL